MEIISRFPFTVNLNPQKQGPGISTAVLDLTNTSVIMIQPRQSGGTVPESVFCLKNLQSFDIMNMVLEFYVNKCILKRPKTMQVTDLSSSLLYNHIFIWDDY